MNYDKFDIMLIFFLGATPLPCTLLFVFKNDYSNIYWGIETSKFIPLFVLVLIIEICLFLFASYIYFSDNKEKIKNNLGKFISHICIYSLTVPFFFATLYYLVKVFTIDQTQLYDARYFELIGILSFFFGLSIVKLEDDFE